MPTTAVHQPCLACLRYADIVERLNVYNQLIQMKYKVKNSLFSFNRLFHSDDPDPSFGP